jgi:Suppressor of fused protein (SUFU)
MSSQTTKNVAQHLEEVFGDRVMSTRTFEKGPMATSAPSFHVLEFSALELDGYWIYATVGCSDLREPRYEFVLCTPGQLERGVELVTMAAWHHWKEVLGVGHTLPIGEPWIPGATCDSLLVSKPHPFGPGLEHVDDITRVLWLLPITPDERRFKIANGLEALEEVFDQQLEFWRPRRPSVFGTLKRQPNLDDICAHLGVTPVPPPPHETLGLARAARTQVPVWGGRSLPVNGTCGWYIGSGENTGEPDFFEPTCVAHLPEACPLAVPFLDLPPGYCFTTDDRGYVDIWFDPKQLVE